MHQYVNRIHIIILIFFRAYWGFADHFKDHAEVLLNSLDHNHRRLLQTNAVAGAGGNGDISNSSSSNSLHTAGQGSRQQHHLGTMPRYAQSLVTQIQSFPDNVTLFKYVY